MEYEGDSYYYVYNLQGDVLGLIDEIGEVVVEYTYDSWGNILSVTGSMASTLGVDNPFRYRGYYYDEESGLYYLNSRYYDPVTGRFVNADGIMGINQDMTTYNLFAYCGNNPVNNSDPSGLYWIGNTSGMRWETLTSRTRWEMQLYDGGIANCTYYEVKVNPFKNSDGSVSLYDNYRNNKDSVYHEQILSAKVSKPSFNVKNGSVGLGSVKASLYTGGWEWENVDLSLLDFGTLQASAEFKNNQLSVGAMVSAWTPSLSFKVWDVNITLSAHVGSFGGHLTAGPNGFKADGAAVFGGGISVSW